MSYQRNREFGIAGKDFTSIRLLEEIKSCKNQVIVILEGMMTVTSENYPLKSWTSAWTTTFSFASSLRSFEYIWGKSITTGRFLDIKKAFTQKSLDERGFFG